MLKSLVAGPERVRSGSRPKQLAMLASAFGQLCALACAPVLSRLYAPADFGAYVTFSSLFNVLNIALSWRYEQALYYAKSASQASRLASLAATLAGWSGLGVLALGLLALPLGLSSELVGVAALATASAFASVLTRVASLLIVRWRKLHALATLNFLRPANVAVVQTLFGSLFPGPATLALGQTVASALTFLFLQLRVPALTRFFRRLSAREMAPLLRAHRAFPLYNLPQNLVFVVSDASIPVLAASRFGHDYAGLYWFAARMTSAPVQVLVESIRVVVSDELVRLMQRGEPSAPWALRGALKLSAPFVAAGIVLALGGPSLFALIFGESWRNAGLIAALLFVYAGVNAAGVPFIAALPLTGMQRAHLWCELGVLIAKAAVIFGAASGASFFRTLALSLGSAIVGYVAFYALVWQKMRTLRGVPEQV